MKFKYSFILIAILIILFSLGSVSASENVTCDDFQESLEIDDVSDISDCESDDFSSLNGKTPVTSYNDTDLSVKMTYSRYKSINDTHVECSWKISAFVSGEIAYNTKIHFIYGNNCSYLSHNLNLGTYDPSTCIWDIGDLNSTENASLVLKLLFNAGGGYSSFYTISLFANATTDSNDVNLSNNYFNNTYYGLIVNGTVTSDSDDSNLHNDHQHSVPATYNIVIEIPDTTDGSDSSDHSDSGVDNDSVSLHDSDSENNDDYGSSDSSNSGSSNSDSNLGSSNLGSSNSDFNSGSSNSGSSNSGSSNSYSSSSSHTVSKEISFNSVSKTSNFLTASISQVYSSLNSIFNWDNDSNTENLSKYVGSGYIFDYTKIPIIIFVLFFIALFAILIYDKIKY